MFGNGQETGNWKWSKVRIGVHQTNFNDVRSTSTILAIFDFFLPHPYVNTEIRDHNDRPNQPTYNVTQPFFLSISKEEKNIATLRHRTENN